MKYIHHIGQQQGSVNENPDSAFCEQTNKTPATLLKEHHVPYFPESLNYLG